MTTGPSIDRSADFANLLNWLRSEGAEGLEHLTIRCSEHAGWGLYATRDFASGETAFRCPSSCALTADAALADATIGEALHSCEPKLDDEYLVLLFLLHCRRQGTASRWCAYVQALPTDDEAMRLLPMFWPEAERTRLLGGTSVLRQSCAKLDALRAWHHTVVEGLLIARFPSIFPVADFSFAKLCWAHTMWSSRAIRLELPGGARPCLVPLLDMMNHSDGVPSTVRLEWRTGGGVTAATANGRAVRSGRANGGGGTAENVALYTLPKEGLAASRPNLDDALYAARCGRSTKAGQELFLNYGAKGNGEMLRCHGFVLVDNACDVFELDISTLMSTSRGGAVSSRTLNQGGGESRKVCEDASGGSSSPGGIGSTGSKDATRRIAGRKLRHFLHRGGLPPDLLDEARVLFAPEGDGSYTEGKGDGSYTEGRARAIATARDGGTERNPAEAVSSAHPVDSNVEDDAAANEGGSKTWDWSLVDWSADDPFAAATAAVEECAPAGEECERRTLDALSQLLESCLAALPSTSQEPSPMSNPEAPDAAERSAAEQRSALALEFIRGQRHILEEAQREVRSRQEALGVQSQPTKRQRV